MQEEEKEYGIRKINNKHWYKVYVSSVNGQTYYKLLLSQKNYDGTSKNYYQNVRFKKTLTPPKDGEQIRLINFIENLFGEDIYNPRYSFTILDFEVRQNKEQKENQAFEEYNAIIGDNEVENFDITDEDLPF